MIRVLLLIISLFILGVPPMYGATTQEVEELFIEGRNICALALQKCTFKMITLDLPLAATNFNDITIASGVYTKLTKDELRAIIYHEVAHAVSNHSEKGQKFYNDFAVQHKRYPTRAEMKPFRYKYEQEADTNAILMLYAARKPILLDTALVKITQPYQNGAASNTHPSVQYRVENVRRLKAKLGVL